MSQQVAPGGQFQVNVDAVLADLRQEIGSLVAQVAMQRSQLRNADEVVAELQSQLAEAMALLEKVEPKDSPAEQ